MNIVEVLKNGNHIPYRELIDENHVELAYY